jgi:hypothetical protein
MASLFPAIEIGKTARHLQAACKHFVVASHSSAQILASKKQPPGLELSNLITLQKQEREENKQQR